MMATLQTLLRRLAGDQRGATAIEYGLIAALIVIGVVAGVTNVAGENTRIYEKIENAVVPVET